jgi:hypothetical protein
MYFSIPIMGNLVRKSVTPFHRPAFIQVTLGKQLDYVFFLKLQGLSCPI